MFIVSNIIYTKTSSYTKDGHSTKLTYDVKMHDVNNNFNGEDRDVLQLVKWGHTL